MKYAVYYEQVLIGTLEINDKGQHRYTPHMEGVKAVEKSISLFHELFERSDWRDAIPLFKNRLNDAKCFSQESDVANQTDKFVLTMISED